MTTLAHDFVRRHRSVAGFASICFVATALQACTAVHYRDAKGNLRHIGLVLQRDTDLAAGERTRVTSFGASLWLLEECRGYALGVSWHEWEYPELRYVDTGRELQNEVAHSMLLNEPEPERQPTRWAALNLHHDDRDTGRARAGSLGLAWLALPDESSFVALYGERSYLRDLGASWNTVLYRQDHLGSDRDSAQAWVLASAPNTTPLDPLPQ